MGEIKSTLDIIMEKTKGLTMSAEEKSAYQKKESEDRARGFFQKYVEGIFDSARMKAELQSLDESERAVAIAFIRAACLERIQPGRDNSRLLDLLQDVVGLATGPIHEVLREYEDDALEQRKNRVRELLQHLKKSGISGSAVIANVEADAAWKQYMAAARSRFQAELRELTQSGSSPLVPPRPRR